MFLRLLVLVLVGVGIYAADGVPVPAASEVDRYVALFNQDLCALDQSTKKVVNPITGAFDTPASDVAREVRELTWVSFLVFLPFLVLPQVLLVYIIFAFRKKDDGRQPAKFMGNHKLEFIWTMIPCIALVIVSIEVWDLTIKMEVEPSYQREDMVVEVRGKSFAWDYDYRKLGGGNSAPRTHKIEIGQDMGVQEPLVLVKGRRVLMDITSNDVNHAWWVPAFGVKRDAMRGRYTRAWFIPEKTGFYKGQCAELCGKGHGLMLISALVVEPADFNVWCELQRLRSASSKIWSLISGKNFDAALLTKAVATYCEQGDDAWRRFALRYWIASGFATQMRMPSELRSSTGVQFSETITKRRAELDRLLADATAGGN